MELYLPRCYAPDIYECLYVGLIKRSDRWVFPQWNPEGIPVRHDVNRLSRVIDLFGKGGMLIREHDIRFLGAFEHLGQIVQVYAIGLPDKANESPSLPQGMKFFSFRELLGSMMGYARGGFLNDSVTLSAISIFLSLRAQGEDL